MQKAAVTKHVIITSTVHFRFHRKDLPLCQI